MKSKNSFLYSLLVLCLVGLTLSFLLTREYYGNAGELVSSLCSTVGSEGGCEKVKESSYSAFPVFGLGVIPISLLGFVFYSFCGSLVFLALKEEETKSQISILLFVSILGLFIDFVLLGISLFIIKAVCSLCAITYLVTICLVTLSVLLLKNLEPSKGIFTTMKENLFLEIKKKFLTYAIIFIGFFACGLFVGKYNSRQTSLASSKDMIQAGIQAYEKAPSVNINLEGVPFAGDEKAPIVIVKYADYNCGHCMHTSHILTAVLAEFSGLVKVYYKNFPLDGNCNRLMQRKTPDASSCIAASASHCADKQKKFLPFYRALYLDTEQGVRHSPNSVLKIAQDLSLNIKNFQACMSSSEVANLIAKEVDEADKLNIQSTPSLFVNGKPLTPGSPDPQFLRELIRHISARL